MLRSVRSVAITVSVLISTTACTSDPPTFGAFPAADDEGVAMPVTKEHARARAQLALEGFNERSYAKWVTDWSSEMKEAISEAAFRGFADSIESKYGRFVAIEDMRVTAGQDPNNVRYSFLTQFETDYLMFVDVYAKDRALIVGVHARDPETGATP